MTYIILQQQCWTHFTKLTGVRKEKRNNKTPFLKKIFDIKYVHHCQNKYAGNLSRAHSRCNKGQKKFVSAS